MIYKQNRKSVQKFKSFNCASVLDSSAQGISLQRKADMANNAMQRDDAPRPNNTGMPDNLKSGIESLSGFSMDHVRVHFNSSKPAAVQALAYTQGTDIHVAPGQEKCLPHEAWHVVQQMAGRVSPTTTINGMPVNDNVALEHEADVMGEKAVQCKNCASTEPKQVILPNVSVQRFVKEGEYILSKEKNGNRNIAVKENEASTIYIRNGKKIPKDLVKLGMVEKGIKIINVNGIPQDYQILKQGQIKYKEKLSKKKKDVSQKKLDVEDWLTTEYLLIEQKRFVEKLNNLCYSENLIDQKNEVKNLIDLMEKSVPLKCLGADIVNAIYALYEIACKQNVSEFDDLVIDVIKDDLILRLSQINNELELEKFKPLVRTECIGSAIDRTLLMRDGTLDPLAKCKDVIESERYIPAYFDKNTNFREIAWPCHIASYINQDLSDDCLYVEDAVGKACCGREKANAHWFAHIYGKDESQLNEGKADELPYKIGNAFDMGKRFNEKKLALEFFDEKKGKNWSVIYGKKIGSIGRDKKNLNIRLIVMLGDDCKFYGKFEFYYYDDIKYKNISVDAKTFKECFDDGGKPSISVSYLAGVMDFMVRSADCAIDGLVVESMSKKAWEKFPSKKNIEEIPYNYILKSFKSGGIDDMSLLSIYKDNLPSQN